MTLYRRAQADAIVAMILASAAIVIGVALWNLYSTTISGAMESINIVNTVVKERTDTVISKLTEIDTETSIVVVYQVSRLDATPIRLYIATLATNMSSYSALNHNLYTVYLSNQTTFIDMLSSGNWIQQAYIPIESTGIITRLISATELYPLSIWVGKQSVDIYQVYIDGAPQLIKIEVNRENLPPNTTQITILFMISISNKLYTIHIDTVTLG